MSCVVLSSVLAVLCSLVAGAATLIWFVFPSSGPCDHSGPDSDPGRTASPSDAHQTSCGLCTSSGLITWGHSIARQCSKYQCRS